MAQRGPYVSYANCGLPCHVSGMIPKESSLLVANEQLFRAQFGIDARTNCEAISISPKKIVPGLRPGNLVVFPGTNPVGLRADSPPSPD